MDDRWADSILAGRALDFAAMTASPCPRVSALIFGCGAAFHVARLLAGWPIEIGRIGVPPGLSVPAIAVLGTLAMWGFTQPNPRYLAIAGVLFLLVAVIMLGRAWLAVPLRIGGIDMPLGASVAAGIAAAGISGWSFATRRR